MIVCLTFFLMLVAHWQHDNTWAIGREGEQGGGVRNGRKRKE